MNPIERWARLRLLRQKPRYGTVQAIGVNGMVVAAAPVEMLGSSRKLKATDDVRMAVTASGIVTHTRMILDDGTTVDMPITAPLPPKEN